MQIPERARQEIAQMWIPYMVPDGDKLLYSSWISDGYSRPGRPKVFASNGDLLPAPPAREPSGRPNARSSLRSRLSMKTVGRLGNLHRQAIADGEDPPPNWFEMTLWRDGRYEMSFIYSAEQGRKILEEEAEWERQSAMVENEEARRRAVERPDETVEGDKALIDEHYALMRDSHAKLWHEPDEPKWLERFLYTHASVGSERIWEAVEVGLVHDAASDSTSVCQRVRWEGEEEFEVLPMAEPQWVIDALEHRRVHHGENGERRRDLIVHLKRDSMRLEWGAARD